MLKVGILGCGTIAAKVASNLSDVPEIKITAVAAREKARASAFAKKNCKGAKAFGSYEELAAYKDVDLIYVTTPNTYHYEHAMLCLKSYKHVLVEKPFTMSLSEAESLFCEAKNRNLFICEAMWTSFMPLHLKVLEWLREEKIGKVMYLTSNLGYDIETVPRLTDPTLGGGSYLDLGVYTTNLAISVLGEDIYPTSVYARKISTEIEKDILYTLETPDKSSMAMSYVTMSANTDQDAVIVGEKGFIKLYEINNYSRVELYDKNRELVDFMDRDEEGPNGYAYEFLACADAIEHGRIQSEFMPWHKSAAIARISDKIRTMY